MRLVPVLVALLAALPALAAPPDLRLPLDCALGETCWLMNYADTDPGPAAKDFRCQARSYDGHDGTDFAVRDAAVAVQVVAPAPGVVAGLRDGEPDGAFLNGGRGAVAGKECGNGVLLRHADGWETQLCHLRPGSIRVRPGQQVAAGTVVGLVGLSGQSEFPHVHLALRHSGKAHDPFTGTPLGTACGTAAQPVWQPLIAYQPGAIYAAGFREQVPTGKQIKADAGSPATLPPTAPALVLWGSLFGIEAGDVVRLRLRAPDGSVAVARDADPAGKPQAWRMEAVGVKAPPGGLATGFWQGEVTLVRGGQEIDRRTARVEVR